MITGRWTQQGDEWMVAAPPGLEGRVATVMRRDGTSSTEFLAREVAPGIYSLDEHGPSERDYFDGEGDW